MSDGQGDGVGFHDGFSRQEYTAGLGGGVNTTPMPWADHARLASDGLDWLAKILDQDEGVDEEDLEMAGTRAEYHYQKAVLGSLLADNAEKVVKSAGRNPDVSSPNYDRRDPRSRGKRRP